MDNESDAVKIDISRRDEEMGLGGQDEEDGQRESSSKTLIERQLDETQSAVHDTIGVLLRRGEDINQLRSRAGMRCVTSHIDHLTPSLQSLQMDWKAPGPCLKRRQESSTERRGWII